ncbi:hypothetical protein TNCV_48511 [Trichonephila clavipes]|nr:hypothetical protein TNCV_48511 [Trichonephila clavipes]
MIFLIISPGYWTMWRKTGKHFRWSWTSQDMHSLVTRAKMKAGLTVKSNSTSVYEIPVQMCLALLQTHLVVCKVITMQMALSDSLPQTNLGVQGGTQGGFHTFLCRSLLN